MSDLVTTQSLGKLTEKKWPGKLSLGEKIVDSATLCSELDKYFVAASGQAKLRCIDGRYDPKLDERNLGPQEPGGSLGTAFAYHLIDTNNLLQTTFYTDAETVIALCLKLGLAPGDHRDNHAHDHGFGCGAIDNIEAVLQDMTDSQLVDDHQRLVSTILGEKYSHDEYLHILGAALLLRSSSSKYFAQSDQTAELLEQKSPGSISVLEGDHEEGLLVMNFIPHTTLATNRFAIDHGGLQAFGYDMWYTEQVADTLFPSDDQEKQRTRFVMARMMIAVATLMVLTDGSLEVLVRRK